MTSEEDLTSVLHKAAKELNLVKYTVDVDINAHRGDGFLGELFKASIIYGENHTKLDLILKKAPHIKRYREQNSAEEAYRNETLFYAEILPTFKKFEEEHGVLNPFDSVPRYITSSDQLGKEIIVLQDLTAEGFEMRGKNLLLDKEHTELIFKIYGHFHAVSFCLKEQKPEEYKRLTERCVDIFEKLTKNTSFRLVLTNTTKQCFEVLDLDEDFMLREKFRKYVDQTVEIFLKSMKYEGNFSGILHGDCWSNNMMFKYQDSQLKHMKLLDFQIIKVGTPVYDLSYFFYSGGDKVLFDDLEHYLDIYYESFSESVKKLDGDPEKLLPRSSLTEEWKIYAKYGMLLSIILVKVKLATRSDSIQLIDQNTKELFRKRVRDILIHMNEIDAL